MPFARFDDDTYDHPKIVAAGPLAAWLWASSIMYANRYLTDGYIPSAVARRLVDVDDPSRVATRLVEVGLWERAEGGYRVHDFGKYQPSSVAVKAEREKNAERVAAWRERQKSGQHTARSNGVTNDRTCSRSPGSPDPDPVNDPDPDPAGTPTPLPPSPQAGQGEGFDAGGAGERNQRRRRGQAGESAAPSELALSERSESNGPQEVLAAPSDEDLALWVEALAHASVDITPANAALLSRLEVAGRGADGGLRLRAPPGQQLGRFRGLVARALVDAGDADGRRAAIV